VTTHGLLSPGGLSSVLEAPLSVAYPGYDAPRNGSSNPLSSRFGSLAQAQSVYPFVTSLSQELDWAASQKLVNALAPAIARGAGEGFWPSAAYVFGSDSVQLPSVISADGFHQYAKFLGPNAKISVSGGQPAFDRPVTAFATAADASSASNNMRFVFEGFRFFGTAGAPGNGQAGIRIAAAHTCVIRECNFYDLDGGTDLIFVINPRVEDCMSRNNATFAHRARDAVTAGATWTGGINVANTAGNKPKYLGCRDYCSAGQFASYWVEGLYGVHFDDSISEGLNPQYAVYFDAQGNGRNIVIEGLHVENGPTLAVIRVKPLNKARISELHLGNSTAGLCIVDASGSTAGAEIRLEHIAFWPAGSFNRHGTNADNHLWFFQQVGSNLQLFETNPAFWDLTAGNLQPNLVDNDGRGTATETGGAGYAARRGKRVNLIAADEMRLIGGTTGVRVGNPTSVATRCDRFGNAVPSPAADSVTTVFTIPHGLVDAAGAAAAPTWADVKPRNAASAASHWISGVDATNITITFAAAPTTGLSFFWAAKR